MTIRLSDLTYEDHVLGYYDDSRFVVRVSDIYLKHFSTLLDHLEPTIALGNQLVTQYAGSDIGELVLGWTTDLCSQRSPLKKLVGTLQKAYSNGGIILRPTHEFLTYKCILEIYRVFDSLNQSRLPAGLIA